MSIETLAASYTPKVLSALLAAFADIRDNVQVGNLARLIELGEYENAIRLIGIDAAAFNLFEKVLADAYGASGRDLVDAIPRQTDQITGATAVFRFDVRNLRAEAFLRDTSAKLVRGLVEEQVVAVRTILSSGVEAGRGPRQIAIDIAGRYDSGLRRRSGGVIGLNNNAAKYVVNMRNELADPSAMSNYFNRKLRDKRFDKVVLEALAAGNPLSQDQIDKLAVRYSDRLLKHRSDTIARTETISALRHARNEAVLQLVDTGRVARRQVKKVWDSSGNDGRTRDSHLAMEGVTVDLDQPFVLKDGTTQLMYPGDTSLGAPADETINCRCLPKFKFDFMRGVV